MTTPACIPGGAGLKSNPAGEYPGYLAATRDLPMNITPDWFTNLEDEDLSFIKRFVLSSGSLKEIAKQYGVTYPTVRLRLDKLISKIEASDSVMASDPYVTTVKQLALNEKIDLDTAKLLINEYNKTKKE